MRNSVLKHHFIVLRLFSILCITLLRANQASGQTEITKWQYGKNGAVSITYDDGSINQFVKAVPIMNQLNMPATFFIITGKIPGSKYQAKFIGRPVKEIIAESVTVQTNKDNFYERASASRFLGYKGTAEYFTQAGALIDEGSYNEAYKIMDELYMKVNTADLKAEAETVRSGASENILTWDIIKTFASRGYEFASHMVDHPFLGALDKPNMLYELEKSREDILDKLGPEHTFSAETPYCSQDERVLECAKKIYPAVRSILTDEYFQQIRFSSKKSPVNNTTEYVQWQRGTYTKTPLSEMTAWVDTTAEQKNIWLILIIHGLDGIGWEPVKSQDMDVYFRYIKSKETDLWIATYRDVTRYIRERLKAEVKSSETKRKITVTFTHSLDKSIYDLPLTLRTVVKPGSKEVKVKQGSSIKKIKTQMNGNETYVLYQALPNAGIIEITL
jgi:peptidoglycan/xylan/chitin deacetylase (PgdA/CDA1 family)